MKRLFSTGSCQCDFPMRWRPFDPSAGEINRQAINSINQWQRPNIIILSTRQICLPPKTKKVCAKIPKAYRGKTYVICICL